MISDLLNRQEFEEEIEGSLKFYDEILPEISKNRYILNEKYGLRTENTRVRSVSLPFYLRMPKLVAGNGEDFSSTVEL